MPRISFANYSEVLARAKIADTGTGPKISDDIQLTMQVDDLSKQVNGHYALAGFVAAVGGRLGTLEVESRNPRGMWIYQTSEPFSGAETTAFTLDQPLANFTSPVAPFTPVVLNHEYSVGPPSPSILRIGTTGFPQIPRDAYGPAKLAGMEKFFLAQGKFLIYSLTCANIPVFLTIAWRELGNAT